MLIIKNATILTMANAGCIQNGFIVIDKSKILHIGKNDKSELAQYESKACKVIDATSHFVLPGFVDAHTHLGIANSAMRWEGSDYNEVGDPVTPQMHTIDGINSFDDSFFDTLSGGITTAAVSPGSANIIGGTICVIKTGGSKCVDKLVVKQNLAMKCAFGENPKNVYGQMQKKSPYTRMANAAILREALFKAKEYLDKKEKSKDGNNFDSNFKYNALIPLLKKEMSMHIHCHRADDIYTALRISKEFDLDTVLVHASEAHFLAQDIKDSGYPVIVGPTMTFKTKQELKNKSFNTIKSLLDIGVKACITTDHPVIPLQQLNICAALAVAAGLDAQEALKSITIYAAQILGLQDRLGSLEVGKDADIAIWDRHPFVATAKTLTTIVNGQVVYSI
ncbi:MAG: amidohydrolase family protein [Clostridiales bacterium]|jgi:imidazolonepropionase-like amidohydrolase|nr:amidohydrolase family protein [Clostridiales bacterium]